ncbi:MAG: FAD:protein FMN transferase [Planctomycetota bacterium]|jgi:thiamine biosynthesis lipoprotein ApbE
MNKQTTRIVLGIIAAACLIAALLLLPTRPAETDSGHRLVMGTFARVVVVAPNAKTAKQSIDAAFAQINKVDELMSDYKDDSEISHVNRDAFKQPVKVGKPTFEVLQKAVQFSKLSAGAFDVTVGPVVQLWHAASKENSVPTNTQLQDARSKVGYEKLILDPNEMTVRFAVEGMKLDLGGIAKGHAIDKAVEAMQKAGALGAMVDIGGDIRCFGKPSKGKSHWLIGVQDPTKAREGLDPGTSLLVLQLKDAAIATSGNYRRFTLIEGKKYSHIIDRKKAAGAAGLSSATIIANNAIDADALATTVTVLGPEKGLTLIENTPQTEAILITTPPEQEFIITSGAAKYIDPDFPYELRSRTYYVDVNGHDSATDAKETPFRSIEEAIEVAQPGDTIFVGGGTYTPSDTIRLNKNGSRANPINLWARPGRKVVLDFSNAPDSSDGLKIKGSYWRLKGLVIQKAGDKGIDIDGSDNIIENTTTRSNADGGIKLDDGAANNLILNCDSYLNYDKATYGKNADGFAAKHGLGKGNAFIGCRAWNNSDDGFDFMEAGNAVRVENCWSWGNGQNIWKDPGFNGNGVGFKLGDGPGEHVIIRCLVWDNAKSGFNIQGNTSSVTLYNNTAWNNRRNYFFDDNNPHKLRNNVSLEGEVVMFPGIDHQNNSWNGGFVVSEADFLSLDDTAMNGPRSPDGNLPQTDFLKLAPGSDLIDTGVNVGLPFNGTAPDMGAFEITQK